MDLLTPPDSVVEHYTALYEAGPASAAKGTDDTYAHTVRRYLALTGGAFEDIAAGHTVLDYGCGLGDLLTYLRIRASEAPINYVGVDVVEPFIADCKEMLPGNRTAFAHITSARDITDEYDHIVCGGVFGYKPVFLPRTRYADHVHATLAHLFTKCRKALHVDFQLLGPLTSADTYEQSIHDLVNWAKVDISKRMIIDRSYLPHEFCAHFYKPTEVDPETGAYAQGVPT